jgi:hypothetical protein
MSVHADINKHGDQSEFFINASYASLYAGSLAMRFAEISLALIVFIKAPLPFAGPDLIHDVEFSASSSQKSNNYNSLVRLSRFSLHIAAN